MTRACLNPQCHDEVPWEATLSKRYCSSACQRAAYKQRHPQKHAAHQAVKMAIRRGDLETPHACEWCADVHAVLHGHHHDYSRQLDVMWLCPKCHKAIHNLTQESPHGAI